ncbi:hypothetical protein ZHAS_00015542 [Anopheles sinensis]|uniref:Uncharacterized protein n=1 Tax=Anopheles sinensis TaxID=74873 RepID=A0A084WBI1_ANOSI|nr:hypothetical protein ZHAS_00015542 [Anopheles sinensis]
MSRSRRVLQELPCGIPINNSLSSWRRKEPLANVDARQRRHDAVCVDRRAFRSFDWPWKVGKSIGRGQGTVPSMLMEFMESIRTRSRCSCGARGGSPRVP